jgi:transposase
MACSEDLRKRVLNFVARGASKVEAARAFEIHLRTVFLRVGQGHAHQRSKPEPTTSRKFSRDELAARVSCQPDLLLKELAAHFGVSQNTIAHALKQMGISRKKSLLYAQAFEAQHRPRRQHFLKRRYQIEQEKWPLVYVDETGFAPSTCRLWARAPIGQRVQGMHNAQQRPRTSLIGGLLQSQAHRAYAL